MTDPQPAHTLSEPDDPHAEYRSVEPWAVGGVLLGIFSIVALLGGVFWLVAAVGIAANVVALVRIGRDPLLDGRAAALLGLALSITFAVAPIANAATTHWMLARQARHVAEQFLEFLCEDSPQKAMNLRFAPDKRATSDDQIWARYRHDPEARGLLQKFVRDPTVRTLLALGSRADVRFYKTAQVVTEGSRGIVNLYYTITYADENDEKTTFFVSVMLERNSTEERAINPWRVIDFDGGFHPDDPSIRGIESRDDTDHA